MLTKISIVVALCSGMSYSDVQKRVHDITTANPGVTVSVRADAKAQCYKGQVLTGKDAKLLLQLGGK